VYGVDGLSAEAIVGGNPGVFESHGSSKSVCQSRSDGVDYCLKCHNGPRNGKYESNNSLLFIIIITICILMRVLFMKVLFVYAFPM
jgi:hypothetical protein